MGSKASKVTSKATASSTSKVRTEEQRGKHADSLVECNICCNNGNEVEIPFSKVTDQCATNRTICTDCLRRHISQAVVKNDYHNIACLCTSEKCPVKLDHMHVHKYADAETFYQYDRGLLHETLEKDPEFRWCSKEGCGSGQLHGRRHGYPRMFCHVCKTCTCFTHRCKWHSGRTCREYEDDAAKSDEVSLLQLLERSDFRRCPGCGTGIEKNQGCSHMTCRCSHEFCWHCLAPYKGQDGIRVLGTKGHKRSCRRYD